MTDWALPICRCPASSSACNPPKIGAHCPNQTASPSMSPPRLRIGIAGAGHFGRYHALKVAASDRATLVGIHDPDAERARTVGWEAAAPAMDFSALLAASDALVVAAPAEAHHDLAAAALR